MTKSKKILHSFLVFFIFALFFGGIVFVMKITGLWEQVNSAEKLQSLILSFGFYGRLLFVFLQFLQVTFVPIPSPILIAVGAVIYGSFQGALLSLSGILFGSAFAFFLGKICGEKIVVFMVGEESKNKWKNFLNKFRYSFVLMMLLPFFPDDVLCLVAGLTDMSWKFFLVTQFFTRPIGILSVSLFSSGKIIPYHGWGLAVWAVIFFLGVILIFLSTKYSSKIEEKLKKMFSSKKIKK